MGKYWIGLYLLVICIALAAILSINHSASVFCGAIENSDSTIVLDAGHGWPDGGAVSCTGVPESEINLQITARINDLFHLLGYNTLMIRKTEQSVYTEGDSIAQKKISDLKERARIANSTPSAILISIHQNYFQQEQYSGPQVFYGDDGESKVFADKLQCMLSLCFSPESNRQSKPGKGIYLLDKSNVTSILIECGFLSNPREEALLKDQEYQKKLACVICSQTGCFLSGT